MKKHLLTLLAFICCANVIFAQNDNAYLLAQSPDGRIVKLVWLLKSVPQGFSGFDVKRKDGLGDWQKLNRQPILPGISMKKSLQDVQPDIPEVTRIKEKLRELIRNGKLREYDFGTFVSKWGNNEKEIQDIVVLATLDFDVSLICGFGYVDNSITQKINYQYGIFAHNSDKLLTKTTWSYGEIPDLDVVKNITAKAQPGKNGIQLIWNADVAKMKRSFVAGFNVYKQGIRLNDQPIDITNPSDPSEYAWYDAGAKSTIADQYSISTESVAGIEGIIRSYTYTPAEHPSEYKKATVTSIASNGFYYKGGTTIKWTFPKEYERFIKGFYIEKDNMPAGYLRVPELISPESRSFVDQTASTVSSYVRVRVQAVYNDKTIANGVEKLYSYFPMVEPPKPQGVKITSTTDNKKVTFKLTWDPYISGDSFTHHYRVYLQNSEGAKYAAIADKLPLKPTSFTYVLQPGTAATYRFCIAGVTKNGAEGLRSDTVSIWSPTTELPNPNIQKSLSDGKNATISWDYPNVLDLAGFRLFMGDTMIADENTLKKSTREFTTPDLQPGSTNIFTLRAITDNGLISEPSAPATVIITMHRR